MSEQNKQADSERIAFLSACAKVDWQQVVLNGGPPCFYIEEDGTFCLRAERWAGHGHDHGYKPLVQAVSMLLVKLMELDRARALAAQEPVAHVQIGDRRVPLYAQPQQGTADDVDAPLRRVIQDMEDTGLHSWVWQLRQALAQRGQGGSNGV